MSNEEFADLFARACQGDQEALAALHSALEEKLRKAARWRLGRVMRRYLDSMDIVQSAQKSLLICIRKGKYDIPDEEKLTALAMRILHRKVNRKWRKVQQDLKLQGEIVNNTTSPPGASDGAVEAVENRELIDHILKYMSKTEKDLFQLYRQHHTITAAANVLGLTPAYARVLWGRMKARLGTMFKLPEDFL
jgi:DNA-directed RNA polymerase specialized sigma24 family protein